jgi:hypothetical protein
MELAFLFFPFDRNIFLARFMLFFFDFLTLLSSPVWAYLPIPLRRLRVTPAIFLTGIFPPVPYDLQNTLLGIASRHPVVVVQVLAGGCMFLLLL